MRVHAAIIGERLMTGHECHYAKKVVAMHRYIFWFLMLTGVLTFCMGLGLPIAFSMDTLTLDVAGFLLLAFLTLGPMAGGIWIFWLGYKRRVCFSPRVSIIRGIMTIRKKPVPSGAGSINYVNEYYVGNVLLHGPPGSSVILDRLHGKFIEVHALFMHVYPSINLSKRYKGIDEALLFNLNDQINLDAAFQKYGRSVFKREAGRSGLFITLSMFFSIAFACYIVAKLGVNDFWPLMVVILAAVILICVLHMALEYGYKHLRKLLDPDCLDLTLEEILKG